MSTTLTLPPCVFFKHTPFVELEMPITNSPPLSPESDLQALVAEGEGLQKELTMAKCKHAELEAEMELRTDTANVQMFIRKVSP